jgi:toxin-antitoxin system PIN domain toxin
MPHLLDVNVLVALFDPDHVHHEAAHAWFESVRSSGWVTCPLTENGLVRVLSSPAYPGRRTTVGDAVERLRRFTRSGEHLRWSDDVSLLDADRVDAAHLSGHREVTDTYLLALAVRHEGTLATFDRTLRTTAVVGAGEEHLVVLEPGGVGTT